MLASASLHCANPRDAYPRELKEDQAGTPSITDLIKNGNPVTLQWGNLIIGKDDGVQIVVHDQAITACFHGKSGTSTYTRKKNGCPGCLNWIESRGGLAVVLANADKK